MLPPYETDRDRWTARQVPLPGVTDAILIYWTVVVDGSPITSYDAYIVRGGTVASVDIQIPGYTDAQAAQLVRVAAKRLDAAVR